MSNYRGQKTEEEFMGWLEKNRTWLEDEWIECVMCTDTQLLDDDIPDYISDNQEEFEEWAFKRFESIGEC